MSLRVVFGIILGMTRKQRFIWEVYFLMIALFIARQAFIFFDPLSDVQLYFRILRSFDPIFLFSYFCSYFRIFLGLFSYLPLLLFIYRIRLFPPLIWQVYFALLVIFDIIGHPYEMLFFRSLFLDSPLLCLGGFLFAISAYIPAYIAIFIYAFRQNHLVLKEI